jgi:hypothetical protein
MIAVNQKDLRLLYNSLKGSAKRRGIPFELTMSDLNNVSFPLTCPILGIPLQFNNDCAKDNSYSFDRISSEKGYSIDNIIIVSNRVNTLKSNATIDEMRKIADFYSNLDMIHNPD